MLDDPQALLEQGIQEHQAGRLAEAEMHYRRVLEMDAGHLDTQYLLGTVLLQLGRFDECIVLLKQVAEARPDVPDALNNLGVAYKAQGCWKEAAQAFESAINVQSNYDQAYYNLGALMEERGLYADAEKCYRRALDIKPDDVPMRCRLGEALKAQNKWAEAEACLRDVLDRDPGNLDARVNLGFTLIKQERLAEAERHFVEILDLEPDYHQVHNNLSYIYERRGEFDKATASVQRALELQPKYAEGYNNLGTLLRSQHRFNEACACFQKALDVKPDFALAEFNLGTTQLLKGDFKNGWKGYERRAEILDSPPRQFSQPRWEGQPIEGRRLFVYSDQGFGDAIQFVRFLKPARNRSGATIVFECQPQLKTLFNAHDCVDELIVDGEALPEFDLQIPLSSLARICDVDANSISTEVSYIDAPAMPRPELRELIEWSDEDHLNVGFVWQGNPAQARDVHRSCPPEKFLSLTEIPRVSMFSLQVADASPNSSADGDSATSVIDIGSHLTDFSDTAAVVNRLDLVITVDTAVAHLAGALGRPVWTLLCHTPDWRWLLDRTDSPWYQTMRLFRQPTWGDWDALFDQVKDALKQLTSL